VGLQYEANDPVQRIRGVRGAEFVFIKRVDRLSVGELQVSDFDIEVGAMDYGFAIDGIIGTDFLLQVGAVCAMRLSCCRIWGCKMPKMKQSNKQTVAEAVCKYIRDQHPGGATFEVMAQGVRKERYWYGHSGMAG